MVKREKCQVKLGSECKKLISLNGAVDKECQDELSENFVLKEKVLEGTEREKIPV